MFPKKTNSWEKLQCDNDKENRQPDHNYCSSYPSSFSSSCSSRSPIVDENNNLISKSNLNNDGAGSFSSGYDSWKSPSMPPFKVHEDQLSRSFDSLLLPLQSYSSKFDDSSSSSSSPPSIVYSPLSSFHFAELDFGKPPFCSCHHATILIVSFRRIHTATSRKQITSGRCSARLRDERTNDGSQRLFHPHGGFNADGSSQNAPATSISSTERNLSSHAVAHDAISTTATAFDATADDQEESFATEKKVQAQQEVIGRRK